MITIDPQLIARLKALIGQPVTHEGQACRVLDLLTAEGLLILEVTDSPPGIQLDQFGHASHRGPILGQIPILGQDGSGPSEALAALLEGVDAA
jgi:hypothetical protein